MRKWLIAFSLLAALRAESGGWFGGAAIYF